MWQFSSFKVTCKWLFGMKRLSGMKSSVMIQMAWARIPVWSNLMLDIVLLFIRLNQKINKEEGRQNHNDNILHIPGTYT